MLPFELSTDIVVFQFEVQMSNSKCKQRSRSFKNLSNLNCKQSNRSRKTFSNLKCKRGHEIQNYIKGLSENDKLFVLFTMNFVSLDRYQIWNCNISNGVSEAVLPPLAIGTYISKRKCHLNWKCK